jgi:hypothetical protein
VEEMLNEMVKRGNRYFGSDPVRPPDPFTATALNSDFRFNFVEAYKRTGDAELAKKTAMEATLRSWDFVEMDRGVFTLMKNPPAKVGYPDDGNNFKYISDDVVKSFGLKDGEKFQLISDERTMKEAEAYRAWRMMRKVPNDPFMAQEIPAPPLPSYAVAVRDINGLWEIKHRFDGRGVPTLQRVNFTPPNNALEKERAFNNLRQFTTQELNAQDEKLIKDGARLFDNMFTRMPVDLESVGQRLLNNERADPINNPFGRQ